MQQPPAHLRRHSKPLAKAAVVVLGMHRSGTSSLAGTLVKLGLRAPKTLMQEHWSNERGFFESNALWHLNDAILASAGSSWDDWRAFNPAWSLSAEAEEFEERAIATLNEEYGAARFIMVKDPRICRMTPFWARVFERSGYAVHIILPVRSPLEVASSLRLRDGFPTSKGLLLWLRHVLDAEAASRQSPRVVLHWPDFLADWRLGMARASEQTGLVWPKLSDRTAAEIDRFLAPTMRHNVVDAGTLAAHPDVNDWVEEAYGAMVALAADPASNSARQRLDDVRAAFEKAARMFGRVFVDFEENVATAQAEVGHLTAQLAEAAGARDGLHHAVAALTGERNHFAAQLAETAGARDGLQHAVAALTGERDHLATQLAEAASARDGLQHAVALLTGERDRLAAELTEASGAHDGLQDAVAALTGERDHLAAQFAEASGARDGLQHAVAALTGERDHLAAQLAEASGARDGLQHAVVALTSERDHLAAQLAEAAGARDSLQHMVAALSDERDSLLTHSAAACAEQERLAREAAEERQRVEGLLLERLTPCNSG